MARTAIDGMIKKAVSRIKDANSIGGQTDLSELFPGSFMKEHTQFSSIEELLEEGSFTCGSSEAAMFSDGEDLDGHVFITTDFSSFEEMTDAAAKEYRAKSRGSG